MITYTTNEFPSKNVPNIYYATSHQSIIDKKIHQLDLFDTVSIVKYFLNKNNFNLFKNGEDEFDQIRPFAYTGSVIFDFSYVNNLVINYY